jgi:aminoglycoside 3-N-acetyltransferase
MISIGENSFWTRSQLRAIGMETGDAVMLHAGMRAVGPVLDDPDTLIGAVLDAIGAEGTLLTYVDWNAQYPDAVDAEGRVPESLKSGIPPFDPRSSRACRDHGVIAEFIRTWPGAFRSGNPGASCAAIGAKAEWFTAEHPLDYGYGERSPFARLVEARGKVLMVGAPLDTMSILHHAEHLARIPGKRIRRLETPLLIDGRVEWRMIEEFDTSDPVVEGLAPDYFATIVAEFLRTGQGRRGRIGDADSVIVPAADIVKFGVDWLELSAGR